MRTLANRTVRSVSGRVPSRLRTLVLGALLLCAAAVPAAACPVCFGQAESGVLDGVRWAVVLMGALVYALIGGGIALVFALRRRARRLQDPRRGLRLVHPVEATAMSGQGGR